MNTKNRTPPRAKLDSYNYELVFNRGELVAVVIHVEGNTDITIADISTEINVSQGRIYVEGHKVISHSLDMSPDHKQLIISTKQED